MLTPADVLHEADGLTLVVDVKVARQVKRRPQAHNAKGSRVQVLEEHVF